MCSRPPSTGGRVTVVDNSTFFDTRDYFKERIEWLPDTHKANRFESALKVARSVSDEKVPLGIFYQVKKPTFESNFE